MFQSENGRSSSAIDGVLMRQVLKALCVLMVGENNMIVSLFRYIQLIFFFSQLDNFNAITFDKIFDTNFINHVKYSITGKVQFR